MSQPIILAVDDDQPVARALARDLERRFSADYDIIVEPSPSTALDRLRRLRDEGTEVALVHRGPVDGGADRDAGSHLETSLPGVFAVGDVRQRSMKRVASAVGEGATAISLIHEYLQEQERSRP